MAAGVAREPEQQLRRVDIRYVLAYEGAQRLGEIGIFGQTCNRAWSALWVAP